MDTDLPFKRNTKIFQVMKFILLEKFTYENNILAIFPKPM